MPKQTDKPTDKPTDKKPAKKAALSQAAAAKVSSGKFNITDKALLCAIDFRKAGNSKKVGKDLYTVEADKELVRASKTLLDSEEYRAIGAYDAQVRSYLKSRALPSPFKGGIWLVPMTLIDVVDQKLTEYEAERRTLVEAFLLVYPTQREQIQQRLGALFDEDDYPEVWKMRAQFSIRWRYVAFGVPNSLKAVKESIFKREQEKAAEMWKEATGEIENLMRVKMLELVGHIVDRLTPGKDGKAKKFQSTLTDNLNDFLGTFDEMNICDDAALKGLVDKAKSLVNGVEAGKLRDDKELRAKINIGFGAIKAELDKIVVNKPTRKVKVKDDDEDGQPKLKGLAKDAGKAPGSQAPDESQE